MKSMKDRNELILLIRRIIGDEKEDGFYTTVQWNNETIKVPNFLFKDGPAQYPEIRISPFLTESQASHSIRIRKPNYDSKTKFRNTIFQIDIYADNIVLANAIESAVRKRIDLFYDMDTVVYGYDNNFNKIDEERNIYFSETLNKKDFKIISVRFSRIPMTKVSEKSALKYKNTYYVDDGGLYVNTDLPIKLINVNTVLNGLVFPDGETAHQKGIIKTRVMNRRSLSELEKNNVERISFELGIFYRMDGLRNPGPLATHMKIDSD